MREGLELVTTDIDSKRMTITIWCSKGDEDRIVSLPMRLLKPLRGCYRPYSP